MKKVIYSVTILMAVAIQYMIHLREVESLLFILKPVTMLVALLLGINFQFVEGVGFVNERLQINIGKACAGGSFFTLLLLMLIFTFIPKIVGSGQQVKAMLLFLLSTYCITIVANASRIVSTLRLMDIGLAVGPYQLAIHQLIGIIFYFSFLFITYIFFSKLFQKGGERHGKTL